MEEFCKLLPKIELHAHLNGSLSTKTLLSLGCLESNVKHYQKLTEILNKTSRTLDECFQLFDVAHNATNNIKSLYTATQSVITEFNDDGVVYLELRTTPRAETNMTTKQYIETVVDAIKNISKQLPIIVKLILCLNRSNSATDSKEVMNLIIEMNNLHPSLIVGVDLCGNPKVGYFPKEEFAKARAAGLKVTLHCGEVKGDKEEQEMLEFKPERLGHGTFLCDETFNSEKLKLMPLEICLSSNVICGTVKTYQEHHIKKWIEHKLPFCLCTDDKGVFLCDLSNEYFLAHQIYKLSPENLYNLSYQAIDYIFAENSIKDNLRIHFTQWKEKNHHYF